MKINKAMDKDTIDLIIEAYQCGFQHAITNLQSTEKFFVDNMKKKLNKNRIETHNKESK